MLDQDSRPYSDTERHPTIAGYHDSLLKRGFDLLLLLLASPVAILLIFMLVVISWISDGSPVFFRQTRLGRNGKIFTLYKIRTLKKSFESAPGQLHTDQDIHRLGRFLRMTRLDELPQLWNIFKGEMSWVGPRPEVPYFVERFEKLDNRYRLRERARPGIAGLAQLDNPYASPEQNLEKLVFDLTYMERANVWMDINILFRTIFVVFR